MSEALSDLSSIMVGIIVIGLIGGVIAATVFAVIPWVQDNAAKQQLDSIVAAESSYRGLASAVPSGLPSGHKTNSYGNSNQLDEAGLLSTSQTYCASVTDEGNGYEAFVRSASGNVFTATDKQTSPENLGKNPSFPTDCAFLILPDEAPYVDPTPALTTLTYKCDVETTGRVPMQGNLVGTETWSNNNTPVTYNQGR